MSVLIMLNNLLHDFAVSVLFSSLLIMIFLYNRFEGAKNFNFFKDLYKWLNKIQFVAWVFIIIGGIVRTLTYKDFEWVEAVGKNQVDVLILKHIILILMVVVGLWIQIKLKNKLKVLDEK